MENSTETWCFIDFENLPKALEYAISSKNDFARIFVFIGSQQKVKIDLSDTTIPLTLVKIEGTGKNNLDFHLIYYLGKCQEIASETVEFVIFSKDTGWDRLIKFIQQEGRVCRRIGEFKKTAVPKTMPTTNSLPADVQQVINKLNQIQPDKRPKRLDRLTNHLNSVMNSLKLSITARQMVARLKQQGVISVGENNQTEYHF